ncbi:hypothetical protein AUK04_03695 [Candidatus Roizmanbacteria bacterium CG2_30_33_16]|uniref:Uncharacterized protein n=1 Tax=Candidatus Roizmanbacteria bacterium CG2_30_33_16 TaxID=1805340 RepID=A0A1J5HD51_9BACT|nr:MAG: hypothetical protein AUK04_03695 [Candidatus Roizmanbacteria bacterium CG2_30_33_16]
MLKIDIITQNQPNDRDIEKVCRGCPSLVNAILLTAADRSENAIITCGFTHLLSAAGALGRSTVIQSNQCGIIDESAPRSLIEVPQEIRLDMLNLHAN